MSDPTIAAIQHRVSDHFGIRLIDMRSNRRARSVAWPRQVAMYLSRRLTVHSLPEIGREFGNRDHTTVMQAITRVTAAIAGRPGTPETVNDLVRVLCPPWVAPDDFLTLYDAGVIDG